jgi:hypothetical protein
MAKVGVIMLDNSIIVGDIEIDEDATGAGGAIWSGPVTGWVGRGDGAPRFGHGGDGRGRGGHHPGGGGRGRGDPSGRDRFPGGGGGPRHRDEPEWHPADPKFRRKRPGQKPESEAPQHEGRPGHKGAWGPEDPGTPAPGWKTDKHGRPIYGRKNVEDPSKPRTDEPAPDGSSESEGAYEGIRQGPGDMHEAWSEGLQPGERRRDHVEDPSKPKTDEEREEAQREAHRGAHREAGAKPVWPRALPAAVAAAAGGEQKGAMQHPKGWHPSQYTDVTAPGMGVGEDATAAAVPVQPEGDAASRMSAGTTGDLDRQAFDKMYNGTPLAGKFDKITDLARQHGIPPALFGAIITQETGRGTSAALKNKNNPAGISGAGPPMTFPDIDAGLSRSAEVIAKHWRTAHENIDELAEIYSPTKNATNDPGNLNRFWPSGVRRFMGELGATGIPGPIAAYDMPSGFGPSAESTAGAIPRGVAAAYTGGAFPPAITAVGGGPPAAFIMHHTSGGGGPEGVMATLNQRGLGVQYIMDREGNITQFSGPGASHMLSGYGPLGEGLSNRNVVGMEVIAQNDRDVNERQVEAAKAFIRERYPDTPLRGHGQVNPGHKEADEGMKIVNAIEEERRSGIANAPAQPAQRVSADLESIDSILDRVYGPDRNK